MISRVFFALVLLLMGLNLYSQQPAPIQEQTATQQFDAKAADEKPPSDLNEDYRMQNWLIVRNKAAERMANLGIESKFAEEWNSTAEDYHVYPNFRSFRIGSHGRDAVLFLPCVSPLQTAYLYLLAPENHTWKVSDKLELDCHYDDKVSFEIAAIRDPQRNEIQVHHSCVGHGTGYWEQHFSVYAVN